MWIFQTNCYLCFNPKIKLFLLCELTCCWNTRSRNSFTHSIQLYCFFFSSSLYIFLCVSYCVLSYSMSCTLCTHSVMITKFIFFFVQRLAIVVYVQWRNELKLQVIRIRVDPTDTILFTVFSCQCCRQHNRHCAECLIRTQGKVAWKCFATSFCLKNTGEELLTRFRIEFVWTSTNLVAFSIKISSSNVPTQQWQRTAFFFKYFRFIWICCCLEFGCKHRHVEQLFE